MSRRDGPGLPGLLSTWAAFAVVLFVSFPVGFAAFALAVTVVASPLRLDPAIRLGEYFEEKRRGE